MEQTLQQVDQPLEDRTKLSFNMALALSLSICRLLSSINSKQDCSTFHTKTAKSGFEREKLPRQEEFAKALYTFDIGQNDLSVGFRKMSYDQLKATIPDIVSHLASAARNIYQQGGRTFWLHNTGPFGCLPVNMFYMGTPAPGYLDRFGCVKAQNEMAMEVNRKLKETVISLRTELTKAAITYVDVYAA